MSEKDPHAKTLRSGVYGIDYYEGRKTKAQLIYRLRRRTDEVDRCLRAYSEGNLRVIVDIGTADGLMLESLHLRFPGTRFYGIDASYHLLHARPRQPEVCMKIMSNASQLPFPDHRVDAIIATAVIEHVPNASHMLQECQRILRPNGILVLTTPSPMMERIASAIGILKEAGHQQTYRLRELTQLISSHGFRITEARKFMFSPIGFPAEKSIERILGPLGLDLLMANQLVAARRC